MSVFFKKGDYVTLRNDREQERGIVMDIRELNIGETPTPFAEVFWPRTRRVWNYNIGIIVPEIVLHPLS